MKFKIDFEIKQKCLFNEFSPVFLLGSCFAEHQAKALSYIGFPVHSNPFGIIYNPVSLAAITERIAKKKIYSMDEFMQNASGYFSPEHHGLCNYKYPEEAVEQSNETLKKSKAFISKSSVAIISLGTALVYRFKNNNATVANCHKLDQALFEQVVLTSSEIEHALRNISSALKSINKAIHIIWTISPVRHLRSGITENNLSKSLLRVALQEHLKAFRDEDYFPAFEIFIDELRDYRFSDEDLSHPNKQAIDYIGDRFKMTYFSEDLLRSCAEIMQFRKFEAHRPFRLENNHLLKVANMRNKLKASYPSAIL